MTKPAYMLFLKYVKPINQINTRMKELTLEITNNCSLNCIQCSSEAGPEGEIFMTLDEVREHIARFSDFEIVRLSGGEPFQHPDLAEIVEMIAAQSKQVQILSCGVLDGKPIPEDLFRKTKPHVQEIIFSEHGFYEIHDQIVSGQENWRNVPPYWDYMMDSIDNAH